MSDDKTMYDGDERRLDIRRSSDVRECTDCISHLEHSRRIANLEHDYREFIKQNHESHRSLWEEMRSKLPVKVFIATMTLLCTIVLFISSMQYTKINQLIDAYNESERAAVKIASILPEIKEDIIHLSRRLDSASNTPFQNSLQKTLTDIKILLESTKDEDYD